MITIVKAGKNDTELIAGIARTSFIESHGHSAPADDINAYLNEKYSQAVFGQELNDESNIYHIIYYNSIGENPAETETGRRSAYPWAMIPVTIHR